MSVVFVPERLRGKAEVNQETLQRVSGRRGPGVAAGDNPARLRQRRLRPGPPPPSQPPSTAAREAGPKRAVTAVSAVAAGGERPADPLHRGVPEQGPRHRLRAVPAYPAQKPHLFSHNCRCNATQRAEDYRVTARTRLQAALLYRERL